MKAEVGKLYMHLKTGGIYKVISLGKIEATMTPCVVYENDHGAWVRPYDEFIDGRFEEVEPTAAPPSNHYGFCPTCGAPGQSRERRPNGNDTCENGHKYPSAEAVIVLSEIERAQGLARPLRLSYVHQKCGHTTTMRQEIAETHARAPGFYEKAYCAGCGGYFPIGEDGGFVWDDGSKVGT